VRLVLTGPVAAAYPGTEIRLVIARWLRTDEPWPEGAEYAQHAGHADFLREGIDGATGA
jgi:hypothetical protein